MTVPAVIFLVLFAAAVAACAAVYVRMSSAARSLQVKLASAEAARDAVLREADAVRGDAQRYLEDKISAEKKLSASEDGGPPAGGTKAAEKMSAKPPRFAFCTRAYRSGTVRLSERADRPRPAEHKRH